MDMGMWNSRFAPHLGSLRAFLESRPDKFCVIPGEGEDFTVSKARKWDAADGGATSDLVAAALVDIEDQLSVPKNDGRLSIPHWKERYEATLGSIRSFVKRWPNKFTVIAGEGKHFRVARLCDGTAMHAIREIEKQLDHADFDGNLDMPRWDECYSAELGTLEAFLKSRSDKFTVLSGTGNRLRVVKTRDAMAQKALAEIDEQLNQPGHDGHIQLPHWTSVYSSFLGHLRVFLESRPDKYSVVPTDDRQFLVYKCCEDLAAQALREIEEQIADPRHDGRIRVPRWNERYKESLGTLRSFVDSFPDTLKVISGGGSKFIVTRTSDMLAVRALHDIDIQFDRAAPNSTLRIPNWDSYYGPTLGPLPAFLKNWPDHFNVKSLSHGRVQVSRSQDVMRLRAIAEIEEQLWRGGSNGHIRIPYWSETYSHALGSFRSFVESLPGKFTVIPEQGSKFSVTRVQPEVAESAINEVWHQFNAPDYDGFVQIADWSERYSPFLGTIRQFLHSHPDKFKITYVGNIMYTYPTASGQKGQPVDRKVVYLATDGRREVVEQQQIPQKKWVPIGASSAFK